MIVVEELRELIERENKKGRDKHDILAIRYLPKSIWKRPRGQCGRLRGL